MSLNEQTKAEIKEFIVTHLKVQESLKQMKICKVKRKDMELKLHQEFSKEKINMFDFEKYRLYIYDLPEPRIMIYHKKT